VTGQKDHLHQGEIPHPVLIKPATTNQTKSIVPNVQERKNLFLHPEANPLKAGKVVSINRRAALAVGQVKGNHLQERAAHIPAGLLTRANRQAKKDHLLPREGRTPAELLITTRDHPKVLAVSEPEIKNHLHHEASRQVHLMTATGRKEVLAGNVQQTKNHFRQGVNHLIHLTPTTNQKEAPIAIGTAVNVQATKNSVPGRLPEADLKGRPARSLIMPTGRSVQNHHTIK